MTLSPLFAVMVHERPPLRMADLPGMFAAWLQDAGGIAALGLAIWAVAYFVNPAIAAAEQPWPGWKKKLFISLAGAAALAYAVAGILFAAARLDFSNSTPETQQTIVTIAGALALLAVALPFAW